MKTRPILFSGPMVRAILDGRKTQTRRVVNFDVYDDRDAPPYWVDEEHDEQRDVRTDPPLCPYGPPGDRLWVRETCQIYGHWKCVGVAKSGNQKWRFVEHASRQVLYMGDFIDSPKSKDQLGMWTRTSIFMPRWASRIELEITGVRIERLQGISEADAQAEGLTKSEHEHGTYWGIQHADVRERDPRGAFHRLWDSINGKAHPWASNPWVWVLEFKRVKP